ncbi:MAG: ATP-binding protein [Solobacterium sp.]|jgi:anti-sigma regulatory factor (Ser/Thr protein kinase)|nr:ATP-binding protein [Solobacterium sp.]MCH4222183.1 ATP-binding protein [Solobacterium sp.]MCH4266016.1 ATP-binding protein [Solobacterium sp.]
MTSILHEEYDVERDDYADAGQASSHIKEMLKHIGIDTKMLRRISVASYEAEINMIIHAWGGRITLDVNDDGTVDMIFKDPGPGIPDIEKAMTPGWSTADQKAREMGFGAGMGLPNIKRVSDEFDIQSSSQGTTLKLGFRVTP